MLLRASWSSSSAFGISGETEVLSKDPAKLTTSQRLWPLTFAPAELLPAAGSFGLETTCSQVLPHLGARTCSPCHASPCLWLSSPKQRGFRVWHPVALLLHLHESPAHGCPCVTNSQRLGPPSALPSSPCHPRGTLHLRSGPTDALASGLLDRLSRCDAIFPASATPPQGHAPWRLLSSSRPPKSPRSHFLQADTPRAHSCDLTAFTAPAHPAPSLPSHTSGQLVQLLPGLLPPLGTRTQSPSRSLSPAPALLCLLLFAPWVWAPCNAHPPVEG